MVLGQILRKTAKRYPHKEAIVFQGQRSTFKELDERINRLANGLLRMGLKKGDRIAFMAKNCPQHIELFYATARAGLTYVPISFRSVGPEILYMVNQAQPRAFFMAREHESEIKPIASEMKSVENFVYLDQGIGSTTGYEELIRTSPASEPDVTVTESDDVMIMWTTGSTGNPKGVCTTHRNWVIGTMSVVCMFSIRLEDVALIFAPLAHVAGLWPVLAYFVVGGKVVILEEFNPAEVLETVEREAVTTINLVPTHLADMVEAAKKRSYNTASLRIISYGAAPTPIPVYKEATKVFGNVFMHIYGLTEAAANVTYVDKGGYSDGEDPVQFRRRTSSCGREGLSMEVRVVDANGNNVKPGEVGEIIARGEPVMRGYLNFPEETSRVLKDGWLYTGDLATVDEGGYIYITDRKGFKIISGGENIYPKEVEDILLQHPAVKEVAVVGVPDNRWGEAIKAVVVLREGYEASENELIQFCKGKMAGYKKPKSVDFVSQLPKSAVGKILKKEIKAAYWK
jgi:acyl-CoA synthetase (AMP-forming)/AMP-acid ligase II